MTDTITPNLLHDTRSFALVSSEDSIRETLERHRPWIQQTLKCSYDNAVFVKLDFDLTAIAVDRVCGGARNPTQNVRLRRLRGLVESLETPQGFAPLVAFDDLDSHAETNLDQILRVPPPLRRVGLVWKDCPIAIKLKDIPHPLVLVNVGYVETFAAHLESTAHMLVTPKVQLEQVLRRLAFLDSAEHRARVHTLNGPSRSVGRLSWDELVLDATIVRLLKEDFETFWAREEWFRARRLPFRRGYLLHGPPGNGKTSVVRAMMSSRRLSAFTMRLCDPQADDSDLEAVFERAAKHRPAVVLLEDLDRAFPRSGQTKSPLSLQSLLNCLDGVSTPEGVVVIATANDPLALDPAVLKRPGRFDRVVHFPNPSDQLRMDYFRKMHADIDSEGLASVVTESDGMSFAQLREAYILAGQQSFLRGSDISAEDLLAAVQSLRNSQMTPGHEARSGFRLERAHKSSPSRT